MTTLVTGGAGFVGLNVVEALLARGEHVVAFSDSDFPAYALKKLGALPGTLHAIRVDVVDAQALDAAFAEHRPTRVVHAAVITSGEARELRELDRIVDVNIKGTAHVLGAAAQFAATRMVYVSSGSAYGAALLDASTVSEDTPARPDTLYSITKHASERLCTRFREVRKLDVVCARLGSVFGPWERDTGVRDSLSLPLQIMRLAMKSEEVILPHEEARRDWIYSRDVARGILALLDAEKPRHELYNLASGRQWADFGVASCGELRAILPDLKHRRAEARDTPNVSFLGHRDRALMATDRAASDIGFHAAFGPENVFSDYLDWLRENRGYYDSTGEQPTP